MAGQRVGYIRVSSADQNTARQLESLELDQVFIDKVSGATRDRPQLEAMIKYVRKGDTLMVHSMDRLGRSQRDLINLIHELKDKGVALHFIQDNLRLDPDKPCPRSEAFVGMLSTMAQFERSLSKERQKEGIVIAKTEGKYKAVGRKPAMKPDTISKARELIEIGVPKAQVARALNISRPTLYRNLV